MELTGTIKSIGSLETIKQLKKKTVLVETAGKYPQTEMREPKLSPALSTYAPSPL